MDYHHYPGYDSELMHYRIPGRIAMALVLTALCGSCGAQMQDSVKKSVEYVNSLQADCVLDHGYNCVEAREDDFLGKDADSQMIPGPYLQAWQVSYEDFKTLSELSDSQKQLKHYKIGFSHSDTHFIVLFQGLLLPAIVAGSPVGIIRSTYGLSTKYWVDRNTLTVSKRLFLK